MLQVSPLLQQYPISDLWRWAKDSTLVLNPEFQRRDNWTNAARSYLIDTLLRGLPLPNIYIRMVTDPATMKTYREVVDGQQRLRTIIGFIDGNITLGSNAKEYSGKKYEDLEQEDQRRFIAYQIDVVQLFDATDDVVLDIFQRLNAYGLSVNSQELRHGKFQGGEYKGEFRRVVIDASDRWVLLWERYKVVSVRARVRMADHELIAEMLGVILGGVTDGGQPSINRLYERYDEDVPATAICQTDKTVKFIVENFSEVLTGRLSGAPHFLMLFAAVAHVSFWVSQKETWAILTHSFPLGTPAC